MIPLKMEWFNVFGLMFMAVILIPNILFAVKCKDGFENKSAASAVLGS